MAPRALGGDVGHQQPSWSCRSPDRRRPAIQESVDVDSDALYPIFVEAVAATHADGFAGLPTLDDLVQAMNPIEHS